METPDLPIERLFSGYYRITATNAYANVKKAVMGEHKGKWLCDVRNSGGTLLQYAGVWKTKREAIEEVQFILKRYS